MIVWGLCKVGCLCDETVAAFTVPVKILEILVVAIGSYIISLDDRSPRYGNTYFYFKIPHWSHFLEIVLAAIRESQALPRLERDCCCGYSSTSC